MTKKNFASLIEKWRSQMSWKCWKSLKMSHLNFHDKTWRYNNCHKKKWIFANKHLCSLRSQKWDILNDFQTLSIQEIFFKELGIRLKIKRIVKNAVAAVPSQYLAAAWHESKWKIFIPENPCEYYYRTRTFHFFQGNCQLRRIFSLDDDLIPSSIRWSNHMRIKI